MKLLFDANLSSRLAKGLQELFPGSTHVRDVGLKEASDDAIWGFAMEYGYTIVTKDADFRQKSFYYGAPPKVMWLSRGNLTTLEVSAILREQAADLLAFNADPEGSLFEIE